MRYLGFMICLLFGSLNAYGEEVPFEKLKALEKDLDCLRSLEADFVQKNSDGTLFKGKVFLERPGKLKFDYETPQGMKIISDGRHLIYFDPSSHQATYLSLENSPACLLLDDPLDFESHATLLSFEEQKGHFKVCMRTLKTRHIVTLFIDSKTKLLKGWTTKDPQGNEVHIHLTQIKKNPRFTAKDLFSFKKPRRRIRQP